MIIKPLYKYTRPDGGETVSTTPPECEYITLYRLIADDGMVLQKDGGEWFQTIDVEDVTGWVEGIPVEPEVLEEESKELIYLLPPVDPKSLMINEVDYIEWTNFRKKMMIVEQDLMLVSESFSRATALLEQLETKL